MAAYWQTCNMLVVAFKERDFELAKKLCDDGANINTDAGIILLDAINNSDLVMIERILECGANIYKCHLLAAYKIRNIEIIKYLYYEYRCSSTKDNMIKILIEHRDLDTIKILLSSSTDLEKNTALVTACKYDDIHIIRYLCEQGADVNYKQGLPIMSAISWQNSKIFKCLHEYGADLFINDRLLDTAFDQECYKIIKYLGKNGFDINIDYRALFLGVKLNKLDFVKYLVENNANIFLRSEYTGRNVLEFACVHGNLDIVKYLCEYNANVNDNGDKAVNHAARKGYINIVTYLVDLGANISGHNNKSVFEACLERRIDMVKYLIENGANVYLSSDDIMAIIISGDCEIVKYLHQMNLLNCMTDDNILKYALLHRKWQIAKYIATNGADCRSCIGVNEILNIIKYADNTFFQYLYENGICDCISTDDLLKYVIKNNMLRIVKYLIEVNDEINKDIQLCRACKYGSLDIVKYLCENGADVNAYNGKPIKSSISLHVIKYLIERAAINN